MTTPEPTPPVTDPAAPGATTAPVPAAPPVGSGLSIAGIVLAVLLPLIGLIVSIVALVRAKAVGGTPRLLAVIGIAIAVLVMIIQAVIAILVIVPLFTAAQQQALSAKFCADVANGGQELISEPVQLAAAYAVGGAAGEPADDAALLRERADGLDALTGAAPEGSRAAFDTATADARTLADAIEQGDASAAASAYVASMTTAVETYDTDCRPVG
ncbi:hypothetical protein [Homoserinibacter sp. YIM 151385]|uniref:hypothetical protein n=1 Tax=Homoserinibacter sp. YIM 151385 TaxID=2985506 RepID=UPI0022F0493C|nr:hypothetical protein [Homoserinibacter sp. YIM 151385]WBU36766.1 hypothetical protein OF852_07390 [Homoserinibacter sp. YIM 151385]